MLRMFAANTLDGDPRLKQPRLVEQFDEHGVAGDGGQIVSGVAF